MHSTPFRTVALPRRSGGNTVRLAIDRIEAIEPHESDMAASKVHMASGVQWSVDVTPDRIVELIQDAIAAADQPQWRPV